MTYQKLQGSSLFRSVTAWQTRSPIDGRERVLSGQTIHCIERSPNIVPNPGELATIPLSPGFLYASTYKLYNRQTRRAHAYDHVAIRSYT